MALAPTVTASAPSFNVNPTSLTFGAILFAFIFYATVKGDLAKWFGIFGLAAQPSSTTGMSSSSGQGAALGSNPNAVPSIGGPGSGTLGNITGGSPQFSQTSSGDTGWMDTSAANGDTGWIDTTANALGGDTGWVNV